MAPLRTTGKDSMKTQAIVAMGGVVCTVAFTAGAGPTGDAFYGDPPDARHPWAVHDQNRPQPKVVPPGKSAFAGQPPAGAVVLFDGTEATLANWEADKPEPQPTKWIVKDGCLQCVPGAGYVRTKTQFGDCQLHVEWAAPTPPQGSSQGRGNSGIFLPGGVEVQVLDNYDNPTYADGFACSVYGVNPPAANALRPPGEFQEIDITFRRPIYDGDRCLDPGYVTVYCNGVLVQDRTQLEGGTGHMRRTKAGPLPEKGALKLQDHGNPVRFRNIWYQPLAPRQPETGINGPMSETDAAAKRKEIAAMVRDDAAKLAANSLDQMLRYAESLVYEPDAAVQAKVLAVATPYVAGLKQLTGGALEAKKDEAKRVNRAFQYLARFNLWAGDFAPKAELEALVKAQGWDKR